MTDVDREIKRLISYIRSCREANIDCTVTIDKSLTHGVLNALEKIQQYREIGTVEECREAVEKQAAERINYETNAVFNNGFGYYRIGKCPICNSCYNSNDEIKYCSKCGKKLDWSKENE